MARIIFIAFFAVVTISVARAKPANNGLQLATGSDNIVKVKSEEVPKVEDEVDENAAPGTQFQFHENNQTHEKISGESSVRNKRSIWKWIGDKIWQLGKDAFNASQKFSKFLVGNLEPFAYFAYLIGASTGVANDIYLQLVGS